MRVLNTTNQKNRKNIKHYFGEKILEFLLQNNNFAMQILLMLMFSFLVIILFQKQYGLILPVVVDCSTLQLQLSSFFLVPNVDDDRVRDRINNLAQSQNQRRLENVNWIKNFCIKMTLTPDFFKYVNKGQTMGKTYSSFKLSIF